MEFRADENRIGIFGMNCEFHRNVWTDVGVVIVFFEFGIAGHKVQR